MECVHVGNGVGSGTRCHRAGYASGRCRHWLYGGSGRIGADPGFRAQARPHPHGCDPDHHVGDCRDCRHAGGGRTGFHGAHRRAHPAPQSTPCDLAGSDGDLHHDAAGRHRPYRVFHASGDRRGGQGTGHPPLAPAQHRRGGFADRHHGLAHLRRRGVHERRAGAAGRGLPDLAGHLHPHHLRGLHAHRPAVQPSGRGTGPGSGLPGPSGQGLGHAAR